MIFILDFYVTLKDAILTAAVSCHSNKADLKQIKRQLKTSRTDAIHTQLIFIVNVGLHDEMCVWSEEKKKKD